MNYRVISSVGPGVVAVATLALILGMVGFVIAVVAESYGIALFCGVVLLIGSQATGRILAYRAHEQQAIKRFIGS